MVVYDAQTYFERLTVDMACKIACGRLFEKTRWPNGFVCPRCNHKEGCYLGESLLTECANCKYQASATAGTIFHQTHVPINKWFLAAMKITTEQYGINATQLAKLIDVSHPTALSMLMKFRYAMSVSNKSKLFGAQMQGVHTLIRRRNNDDLRAVFLIYVENGKVKLYLHLLDSRSLGEKDIVFPTQMQNPQEYFAIVKGAISHARRFFLSCYHHFPNAQRQLLAEEFTYRFNDDNPKDTLFRFMQDCCIAPPPVKVTRKKRGEQEISKVILTGSENEDRLFVIIRPSESNPNFTGWKSR